jgi:hydrogenase maturation protease
MNFETVEKIANAVLYEGYLLYPYRRSAVKNRQRFNFGVLYPPAFCDGVDVAEMRTECLIRGDAPSLEVKTRFLQLLDRGDWQEGREREVSLASPLESLPVRRNFQFDDAIAGEIELTAAREGACWKIAVQVRNRAAGEVADRDGALLRSMVSVHSILRASDGEFISLLEPPPEFRAAAEACRNVGNWPVLVGDAGERDIMLASPIILYDYPQIAPESPGDLFDGTEIDEILALRILTMTDEEKQEVRQGDERARRILERTEMLPPEQFQKMHGALRGLSASKKEPA